MTTIDFNALMAQAKTASFDALVAGDYDLQCTEATSKPASTGKEMVKARYKVLVGPSAGRTVFNNYVISPESPTALAIFFRDMKSHGLDEAFFAQQPDMARVAAAMVGRSVRMTLGVREWPEGSRQFRNEVKKVMPLVGGGLVGNVPMPGTGAAPAVPQPGVPSGFGAQPVPQPTATPAPQPVAAPVAPQPPAQPAAAPVPQPVPQPASVVQPQPTGDAVGTVPPSQPATQPVAEQTQAAPPQAAPPALPF